MPTAYGYILKTTDCHGEEIDMYLASMPDDNAPVFVIDQVCPHTGCFDEHKVMLGFSTIEEAIATYETVFSDGSGGKRLGDIVTFPGETIFDWIGEEGYSIKPASATCVKEAEVMTVAGINTPPPNPKAQPKPVDATGGVIVTLPDLSKGPTIKTCVAEDGCIHYSVYLYSALCTDVWSNLVDAFCRTLDLATDGQVMHVYIASPGGSVFLMGRMISAIKSTKARVITYAQGCVASAATTVWVAGHERHILPGAYFMQHMSSQLMSDKSSVIAAKSVFCVEYISKQLEDAVNIGLFTPDEVDDMITKSSDIYISGREAISRVGQISGSAVLA
jgi:ATP-dependent protease ClpP protease subunit